MNESTEILLLYHMQTFTSWISEPEVRHQAGWSFIAVIGLYMAIHMSFMIRGTIHNFKLKCKRMKMKSKVSKMQKAIQKKKLLA